MKIARNGLELYVEESGPVDGIPVIFTHGMTFDHTMWVDQTDVLKERYRVITWDVRGHGKSGSGDYLFTFREFVDDLISVLDSLGVRSAVLAGLSMGGGICLRTWALYPSRVKALILCDTSGHSDTDESRQNREETIRLIRGAGLGEFSRKFLPKVFAQSTFDRKPEIIETFRRMIEANNPRAVCATLIAQMGRISTTHLLETINIPAVVINGEHDVLTPPEGAKEMAGKMQKGKFILIPDAGHISNAENPGDFNRAILDFLQSLQS